VLLEAAAAAGNLDVWRQLLLQQLGNNSTAQQQQQQQQEGLPAFDWWILSLQQISDLLRLLLPQRSRDSYLASSPPQVSTQQQQQQQQQWQADEDAARLQMADLLWQVLVVQQGREAVVREFLDFDFPEVDPERRFPTLMTFWMFATPTTAQWLLQHQLLPPPGHALYPRKPLWTGIADAVSAGDFARALELHNAFNALPAKQQQQQQQREPGAVYLDEQLQAAAVVKHSIMGHLRRACAAGDAAAVVQLERLVCFAGNVFSKTQVSIGIFIIIIISSSRKYVTPVVCVREVYLSGAASYSIGHMLTPHSLTTI
jgi:hypothetical protein